MLEERVPPQSIDAEQSVLGAMLIDNAAIAQVTEIISASDFYREAHRVIFDAMMKLYAKNEAVDLITITDVLRRENKMDDVGGIAYITSLANAVPTAANVKYHAKIVYEKSVLRQMVKVSTEIAAMGYEAEDEVSVLLDKAESRILEISNRGKNSEFTHIGTILGSAVEMIQALTENKGGLTGIPTGFTDLDKLTSGLHPSDFIILAARPSMGKTAFALNVVQNVALRAHKKLKKKEPYAVAFFSLEMSKEQLVNRMLCAEANIDSQRLRTGEMAEKDWHALWAACEDMHTAKIYIDDTPGITAMALWLDEFRFVY